METFFNPGIIQGNRLFLLIQGPLIRHLEMIVILVPAFLSHEDVSNTIDQDDP